MIPAAKKYQLGKYVFQLTGSDEMVMCFLDLVLPPCSSPGTDDRAIAFDVDYQGTKEEYDSWTDEEKCDVINLFIDRAFKYHGSCLWIDAAALATPFKQTVLISGASHSGKSTSAMALAFGHGWKVVAEDIALLDLARDQVVTFATPFSTRPGSIERVEQATGVRPGPVLISEWVPAKDHACHCNPTAFFDLAFFWT